MVFWQGYIKGKIEERIGQSHASASEVMKDPASGQFISCRVGLNYVLMYEMPTEETQDPPTEGPISPSTPPTRNFQSLRKAVGNVHQSGTYESANNRPQ